ncbi:iron-containing alcohol dehydrogenase [Bacteroides cellulosilyticus]|jgi:alcohol dehydrogenase YqhD (iron-dependent ADH family)|uniref:iron-containing alcohol dehydrogenase n=1 Tax=Bacteroides cellulosilyticus TaxID=246787 RepID=UPI0018A0C898|nr:iron-containing alcohol dehydrogenase [Bacteroides cellulosilyticus]MBX9085161.1 iron-containing alcohol dehydrogenase [Bacteroides cellulosilyticus]QUT90561.1 Long-chain-alcohol dehydrogenase 2 [Bacteroides cellulosilyticus]
MNNFVFYSPTEFVFGKATEMQVGALARKHGARKVMIVYGGGSVVRSGLLDRVKQSLQEAGIEYCLMGGVQPNPVDTKVYEGIEFCRREQADMLLPVGGGSVIDTAKAIAAGVLYEGDFWDFYIGKAKVTKALKVAVVLTIPAAGSEGSGNTVITKLDGLQKLSLRVPEVLRPVFSIMNPELTYTLPPFQTACGVADMMAHIMERYFANTQEVEIGDRLCEGTLMAIINEAPKVMRNPEDYGARANLMWAGMIAHNGTCGVGCEEDWASHFLEHEISAIYGVTHGAGLSVIFPAWMTWMVEHNVGKIAQYAVRVWGVPESEDKKAVALEGIGKLKAFFSSLGLPVTFKELGVENPDIDRLADSLHRNKGELVGNYVKLTKLDSKEIYRLACAGE